MPELNSEIIEMHFPVRGITLPSDHAYAAYSAISTMIPSVHGATWLGIHTIKGRKDGRGIIKLDRFTKLRLRLPAGMAPELCKLAGATLDITGHQIRCGIPQLHRLRPSSRLRSRLVMIKCKGSQGKTAEQTTFLESLGRQLATLGVDAGVSLERNFELPDFPVCRRVIKVKSAILTGYGVILDNLSDQDSLLIQEKGLGGKMRMGCGLFDPIGRE